MDVQNSSTGYDTASSYVEEAKQRGAIGYGIARSNGYVDAVYYAYTESEFMELEKDKLFVKRVSESAS